MATRKKVSQVQDANDLPLAAHEIEWPELVFDVAIEAFDDLSFAEARLFLAMLGTSPDLQGDLKTKAQLSEAIHLAIANDTVRAQVAYDRIIRQVPEPATLPPVKTNAYTAQDFWPTFAKVIDKTKQDLSTQVLQDLVTAAMRKIDAECRVIAADQLKAFRKIEVSINNDKPVAMKGLLHEKFEIALKILSQGFPVMLVGPTQCGKSTLGKQLASALKLDFAAQSFSGGLTESKLTGRVLPDAKGTRFVGTPFLKVYENGGLFLADELDAGDPNVITSLNMGIANGEIWLPERDSKPLAIKHKNFRLIAACNTFGFGADARYVGRNALDYATLERFGCGVIYMDYDKRIEAGLARDEICQWAWTLRDKIRRAQLNREMSTRTILVTEQMTKAYGWTKAEWNDRFFASWSNEEKRMVM